MKIIGYIVIAVLLVGGLFYLFQPKQAKAPVSTPRDKTIVSPSQTQVREKAVSLVVKNNEIVSGNQIIKLDEDDTV
jgi:hypothetical protein